jgi:hypothetical protein
LFLKTNSSWVVTFSTQLNVFMQNHCFYSWQLCALTVNSQTKSIKSQTKPIKWQKYLHFYRFCTWFYWFFCGFTIKTTENTVTSISNEINDFTWKILTVQNTNTRAGHFEIEVELLGGTSSLINFRPSWNRIKKIWTDPTNIRGLQTCPNFLTPFLIFVWIFFFSP